MIEITADPSTRYTVTCRRAGVLVWEESFTNLVTVAGRNKLLDAMFKTGLAAPAWSVGLVSGVGFTAYAPADTMASHAGWAESVAYSEATRRTLTLGGIAAATVSNVASKATFTANAETTLRGAFLTDVATKGGATGTLYGIGDFSVVRSVIMGDVLNVIVTLSM